MFNGSTAADDKANEAARVGADNILPLILEHLPKNFNKDFVEWTENAESCQLCESHFSKLKMKGRHHCRKCGKAVCDNCSKDNNLRLS